MFDKIFQSDTKSKNPDSIMPHPELLVAINLIYKPCMFKYSAPIMEKESSEYGAYLFELESRSVIFRVAKITPTKTGQFVTLWKRTDNGPIAPYDISDQVDLIVVAVSSNDNFGQFIFPKSALYQHSIFSNNNHGGKRAIRVYPPWDAPTSPIAIKTQAWQLNYFLEITKNKPIDLALAKILYMQT